MKKLDTFQSQKLINKHLKTVKGGEDSTVADESLNEDGTPRTKDGTIVPPRNQKSMKERSFGTILVILSALITYTDKLGIEFNDKKWGTILINFKTDRNKNIKRAKLLTGLSTGADAPF